MIVNSHEIQIPTPGFFHCFLDLQIGTSSDYRLIIKLYAAHCPKTVENFRQLCTGALIGSHNQKRSTTNQTNQSQYLTQSHRNKGMSYAGSKFHRLIPGFVLQGGDFTKGDGTGGSSIYSESNFKDSLDFQQQSTFPDEASALKLKHNRRGILSMANKGPDTNSSQFFILFAEAAHLDGKHAVFGEVIEESLPILDILEKVPTSNMNKPKIDITIKKCGELIKIKKESIISITSKDNSGILLKNANDNLDRATKVEPSDLKNKKIETNNTKKRLRDRSNSIDRLRNNDSEISSENESGNSCRGEKKKKRKGKKKK